MRRNPRDGQALALLVVRWLVEGGAWRKALHAARAAMRVLPADHPVVKEWARPPPPGAARRGRPHLGIDSSNLLPKSSYERQGVRISTTDS